jgi:hypothetical protein
MLTGVVTAGDARASPIAEMHNRAAALRFHPIS